MRERTHDSPDGGSSHEVGAAVSALYDLTHVLRRECPWDRDQTAATIVPHTIEETYEVADVVRALQTGETEDLHELEDELGDLLFQVCFLAMWCEERDGTIDLASVARAIHAKLVRRHPHVFGDAAATSADEVRGTWEQIKQTHERTGDRGLFDGVARAMPAVLRSRKLQQRAADVGFDFTDALQAVDKVQEELDELREAVEAAHKRGSLPIGESMPPDAHVEHEVGDLLTAVVNVARMTRTDPELSLAAASDRFVARVTGAIALARAEGYDWSAVDLEAQERYYQRAKASGQGGH